MSATLAVAGMAHENSHVGDLKELAGSNFTIMLNITKRESELRAHDVANSVMTAAGYRYLDDAGKPVDLSSREKINDFLNSLPPNPREKFDDPIYKPPQ